MDIGKCFSLWLSVAEPLYYSLLIHIAIRAGGGIFTYGLSGDNTQVTKAIDKSILDPTDADD